MKAIIPIEIWVPTLQTKIHETANTEVIAKNLDMEDELREAAVVRMASHQQRMTNLYNMHVKLRAFRAGDLILRRVFENTVDLTVDKFQPNWEGPYTIVKVGAVGSYTLDKIDGTPVPRMWNSMYLMRYIINKIFL